MGKNAVSPSFSFNESAVQEHIFAEYNLNTTGAEKNSLDKQTALVAYNYHYISKDYFYLSFSLVYLTEKGSIISFRLSRVACKSLLLLFFRQRP